MAEILSDAERRGFRLNFALEDGGVRCPDSGRCFGSDEVKVVYSRSVDTGTDPGDDATSRRRTAARDTLIIADPLHVDPRKAALIQNLVRGLGTEATL